MKPIKVKYRSYDNFNLFKSELRDSLNMSNQIKIEYVFVKETFMEVLHKDAHMKEKIIRGNNAPFMIKTLPKASMHRTKLKNNYNLFPSEENNLKYKKQKKYCVNLVKKTKKI